jgi:hypothetical protein
VTLRKAESHAADLPERRAPELAKHPSIRNLLLPILSPYGPLPTKNGARQSVAPPQGQSAGVIFVEENGERPGVRLEKAM